MTSKPFSLTSPTLTITKKIGRSSNLTGGEQLREQVVKLLSITVIVTIAITSQRLASLGAIMARATVTITRKLSRPSRTLAGQVTSPQAVVVAKTRLVDSLHPQVAEAKTRLVNSLHPVAEAKTRPVARTSHLNNPLGKMTLRKSSRIQRQSLLFL